MHYQHKDTTEPVAILIDFQPICLHQEYIPSTTTCSSQSQSSSHLRMCKLAMHYVDGTAIQQVTPQHLRQ